MKAIVAVDLNWGIGYRGDLLKRIPEDMKFFRKTTIGKVVVMGRKTFESLPRKEPLKDRINIVLSENVNYKNEKVIICSSIDELFLELKKYNTEDIFVIGGEAIYTQLLPYCTEAYVTRIEDVFIADKYFCNLDKEAAWELVSASDVHLYSETQFKYLKYINTMEVF